MEAGLVRVSVRHLASTLPRLLLAAPGAVRRGGRQLAETRPRLLVQQHQLAGEGSPGHDGHLHHVSPASAPDVHCELELPDYNTEREEEEKTGEED